MRTKFSGILTLLLAFVVQLTFAQEKTVSGTVTDNTGLPLPGVNIIVKNTTNGTQSDFDGNYTLQVNVGETLVFSYVGFKTVEQAVTAASNTYSVLMEEDAAVLEEVVITAQGIKKEKKALGYAVSSIKEEAIKNNPESDLTRALSGKAAGINITTQNGLSGSANKVVIRGQNSFSGNNNALYVIDGVPISNDTNAAGAFTDGNMGGSRSFDIDPSNIESINVLKGLAAATLYGSEGRNGVILITTKTGSTRDLNTKQEIQVTTSYFINEVGSLPDYQNKWGGGFEQANPASWFYSNWGPGFFKDGIGGWGSEDDFNEDGTLPHPYSTSSYLATNYPDYQALWEGATYEWRPRNSVEEFFRQGVSATASINIRGRSDDNKVNYGVSYSHLSEEGFTPGNDVTRNNMTVSGGAKLSNNFTANASMTYSRTNMITPPVAWSGGSSVGYAGSSIFGDLLYTPRSIDFYELPFELPDGSSIYYRDDNAIQHPLWTLRNARFSQLTNRVNGFASLQYDFDDHLNLKYQGSVDVYSEDNVNRQNKGGVVGDIAVDSGFYDTWNNNNLITDHLIIFSGNNYSFFDEKVNLSFNLGGTSRSTDYNRIGVESNTQQVFDFFDHSGFVNQTPIEFHQRRNIVGLFGQASIDYDNIFFLNFSGRNDWVSNSKENSKFYPSVSASFIPTAAFDGLQSENGINYMKLRAGYGTSANFATGYPTATSVELDTQSWIDETGTLVTSNTTNDVAGNQNLLPELYTEIEFGIELKLFNRLTIDASYYDRKTEDLIISSRPIPASTGFTTTATNVGEIVADGWEIDLGLDIFKNPDAFNWNMNVNFTKHDSEVTDLGDGSDIQIYAGFTNLGNGARVGYPLGSMFGARVARNENGQPLIDDIGSFVSETLDEEGILPFIGDPNPDFIMNYTSTMSYKGFSLGVQVNHVSGGDIYSQTIATLLGRGLTTDTEDRLSTFILPGVSQSTGEPNRIQINNSNFYFDNLFAHPAASLSVFDASVIRLQEVSLAYTFPSKFLDRTPFGNLSIKVSGNNLWFDAYNTPEGINFDPNVTGLGAGNGQGFEFLTGPSSKRYGISVNATF
jgi:TonB-linked SusC/RagA family outer membrane protein